MKRRHWTQFEWYRGFDLLVSRFFLETIFSFREDDFDEHQNCHGSVFNVVKKYNNVNSNYICKAELKKDHKTPVSSV